jgi:hypothetical protein
MSRQTVERYMRFKDQMGGRRRSRRAAEAGRGQGLDRERFATNINARLARYTKLAAGVCKTADA